jgi:hypothetical protein
MMAGGPQPGNDPGYASWGGIASELAPDTAVPNLHDHGIGDGEVIGRVGGSVVGRPETTHRAGQVPAADQ